MTGLAQTHPSAWPAMAAQAPPRAAFTASLFLWLAALVAFPFYILSSGSVQVSSILFLLSSLAAVLQLLRRGLQPLNADTLPLFLTMAGFVFYSGLVSLFWAISLSDSEVALAPSYYAFNLVVIFLILSLYRLYGVRLIRLTRWVILASVTVQFILSFFFASRGFREFLFFNNANQLGYYALVCASIMALPLDSRKNRLQDGLFTLGILMCTWLALLSLSKAATISTIAFLVLSGSRNRFQLGLGALVVVATLLANFGAVERRFENLNTRFQSFGEEGGDDSLEGRGYDRIWENPGMLLAGAGEKGNYRWDSGHNSIELHSTVGTIVFSYGIPGTLLMATFLGVIIRKGGWRIVPFMIPEFLFSLTHMGLRFVMTWVYFLMLFLVALEWRRERQFAAPPPRR